MHGQLHILHPDPWLELARFQGRSYSHQGLLPGVLLVPFVAIFGSDFNLRHFAALLGGGMGAAAWSLATRIGLTGRERILGWAFPVLGTTFWYEAKHGTTWGVAALSSGLFLFLSLNEWFGKRRLPVIGLWIGLAAMSRPGTILALLGFAVAIWTSIAKPRRFVEFTKRCLLVGLGVLGPAIAIVAYNLGRFGTLYDKSAPLHYMQDAYRHQVPPGEFSIRHLPFNLYSWFFLGPHFQPAFPFIRLNSLGQALPLTSPAFITALGSRRERWLWLAAGFVVIPAALHYANGFTQFGMRYLLDTIPFLSALIFLALKDRRAAGFTALLAASIAINAFGVAYTTVFDLR